MREARLESWTVRRAWAGRHPAWASLLYATTAMVVIAPVLALVDPSMDNNEGDFIWSLALVYVLYPALFFWNLSRWRPGGRFSVAWVNEHGAESKPVRWPTLGRAIRQKKAS